MTKIDIVSGFLGSGKTTFIKKLLEENIAGEKVVIVENEFGKVGIDGSLLQETGIDIVEINSGCICCTLVGEFSRAIELVIKTYQPDRVIIEPSGVGKLSEVLSSCTEFTSQDQIKLNGIVTIVDVVKYEMNLEYVTEYFEDQIRNANTIFLSRTQKATVEKIRYIVEDIKRINKNANIVTTPWDQLESKGVLALLENKVGSLMEEQEKVCTDPHCNHDHHSHKGNEFFERWEMETSQPYTKGDIEHSLKALSDRDYGIVLRAKGILATVEGDWIQFDFVPGEYEIRDISPDYTGRLCVIGKDLNKGKVERLFACK
ncbi:G3E family GTPase [Alkalibaculum bacchi]|uniref:G3E family GTPase n=1 Tax=Alkalibaculum bacchi TaxID=645887 RepID=A0A366IB36_9FIRM|nr:GTP-binding protein [Alkalibaculum bacchi]RBP66650.1 G3E family GTPase [Alkalibaculum bacchi]